jgi:epoxyqueuosine reductase
MPDHGHLILSNKIQGGIKMNITAKEIYNKALELGYSACGIIKADNMSGYEDMIKKRIEKFPETKQYHSNFANYAKPQENEQWVKSIIVCAVRYGKYKIPEELQGRIGKYYLTAYPFVPESQENKTSELFKKYLTENGVQFKDSGTASRYAAVKAGIGIIRKNNFLYTEHGSWVRIETWLIDQDIEYIHENNLQPCPDDCTKCIDACATGSLSEAYQMNCFTCTSPLTWGVNSPSELRMQMKNWLYGCDDCQDCCPMNEGCWDSEQEYPGLDDLLEYLTLEQLCTLDDETVKTKLVPKFFFIGDEKIRKWKANALRAMAYQYKPEYLPYIKQAMDDENELVREMAKWAFEQI